MWSAGRAFRALIQNALENRTVSEKPGLVEFPYSEPKGTVHSQIEAVAIPFDDYHDEFERFRNNTAGVICHVRVMNDLYMTFNAIKSVISARSREDVITRVVAAMKEMGHVQGRLYLADESGRLVGNIYFGPEGRQQPEWFASGPVRLGGRDDPNSWESWYAIENRRPVVFVFDPAGNDRDVRLTREGLEVVVSQSPPFMNYLIREPGEFWVDLPLLAGDQVVGKLSLDCVPPVPSPDDSVPQAPKAKHPRDVEFLRVFCGLIDVLLQAWNTWSRDVEDRIQARRETSERVAHDAFHDIKGQLLPIGVRLREYRRIQKQIKLPRLAKNNDALGRNLKEIDSFCISFLLRSLDEALQFERRDLGELFQELELSTEARVEVAIPRGEIEADIDQFQFLRAIHELIHNSHKHSQRSVDKLRVTIRAERIQRDTTAWVRIVVADNGVGIPPSEWEHLFEKYASQPAGPRTNGRGLASIERTIRGHQGTIHCESGQEESGAQFVIELPQYQQPRT